MKKVIKFGFIGIVVCYLMLFVSYKNGYYERIIQKKKLMTEEMILKYETDLANGIDVSKNDYIVKENDYNNLYTQTSLKISKKIEKVIDKGIKFVFRKINDMVEE